MVKANFHMHIVVLSVYLFLIPLKRFSRNLILFLLVHYLLIQSKTLISEKHKAGNPHSYSLKPKTRLPSENICAVRRPHQRDGVLTDKHPPEGRPTLSRRPSKLSQQRDGESRRHPHMEHFTETRGEEGWDKRQKPEFDMSPGQNLDEGSVEWKRRRSCGELPLLSQSRKYSGVRRETRSGATVLYFSSTRFTLLHFNIFSRKEDLLKTSKAICLGQKTRGFATEVRRLIQTCSPWISWRGSVLSKTFDSLCGKQTTRPSHQWNTRNTAAYRYVH